jgi:hypothetical protein
MQKAYSAPGWKAHAGAAARKQRLVVRCGLWLGGLALVGCAVSFFVTSLARDAACPSGSLNALLSMPASGLARMDIGRVNLLCAQGLSGTDGFDLDTCLLNLDEMAARVRRETGRHFYRFQSNPAEFENSEGFFRMLMLAVVLAEDFGVH